MTPEELSELEELSNKATPGPWVAEGDKVVAPCPYYDDITTYLFPNDTLFIAAARNAIPKLIARVRELEVERDELKKEVLPIWI